MLWILTVRADGAVPLSHRLADGNTEDSTTHLASWQGLVELVGRADFLYLADCKLATREAMGYIDIRGGRFVTVLPRSRKEDAFLRDWMRTHEPDWLEAARQPGKRQGDPDDVWQVAAVPIPSAEGYRIVWVHSSSKHDRDETARHQRIARALHALDELARRLAGPRCRLQTQVAVEQAAEAALADCGAERYLRFTVTESVEHRFRQERRGRPGSSTRYRKLEKTRFHLHWQVDETVVSAEAASDGCFPLLSNDRNLQDSEILAAYRYQPNLEKRHHQLKGVQDAAPVFLKSPARIEALFCCQFLALLCCTLAERELRQAMAAQGIDCLALYPEERACPAPTAARVFEVFTGVNRHHLLKNGEPVQVFEPELTPLQAQLLEPLGVPTNTYRGASL